MTAKPQSSSAAAETPGANKEPLWTPKLWAGMDISTWTDMLARHRFAVSWRRIPMALGITAFCASNTILKHVQQLVFGRRLARVKITEAPIFVIGHWRSGTTLLHELLAQDARHTFPTTYECFSPHHYLLTQRVVPRFCSFALPKKRLQDDMALGWNRPQEDEFALANLGGGSPMLNLMFPNHAPEYDAYLDLEELPAAAVERWKNVLRRFLSGITMLRGKRIILKSPQHTSRIRHLVEMFPEAQFVYIVRDPLAVIPSTIRLWKILSESQGLQVPNHAGLERRVIETFCQMHQTVERTRPLVAEENFHSVRYEDLVRSPLEEMRSIYKHFGWTGYDNVVPRIQSYLDEVADHRQTPHRLSPQLRSQIEGQCAAFMTQYGYLGPAAKCA